MWNPPDFHKLRSWVSLLGYEKSKPLLTIIGPDSTCRAHAYRMLGNSDIYDVVLDLTIYSCNWDEGTLLGNISRRISIFNILGVLAARKELTLNSEVAQLLDRGFFRVTDAFKILWEVRFLYEEGEEEKAETLLHALAEWSVGRTLQDPEQIRLMTSLGFEAEVASNADRYDMIFLWLTLARSNKILDRIILPFDGFEKASQDEGKIAELEELLQAAERWASLGCPLGIVVGIENLNVSKRLKDLLLHSVA